ncbi:uncharacterized protein [Sinocyclocheilus grahami]|uniref:uncharacterized protein n=1 Tax=Sinocyclocheilus grahami TaxID=75366 RepID=UPI0007AD38F1|nr:PREDICTED: uncharacterized protein LOC107569775 [Sinocyclocheilus grahami]
MSCKTDSIDHWEDLKTWLSVATDSLLPKAAETLRHQTQDQLDDNIANLMKQDPRQSYSHKELVKITGSLSHTLIATLKLSDRHAAHLQQELTRTQRRVEQLELEAQERQEGPDGVEQGTKEEITRLKETLAAATQEMERGKADYADLSNKLQYAEQLLEKAKVDFRDKNSRIKGLETHLDESRNEISRLSQIIAWQADYHLLREALIKEFADPESEQGLVAALETRQGRHESPQAYYSRLRRAHFGTRNEPNMENDLNFKTLFLRNLHPGVNHHLGVLACPRTMNAQQLRDLAQKAYGKQKMAALTWTSLGKILGPIQTS